MNYRTLFAELGRTEKEIDAKIDAAVHAIFEDPAEKFYFEADPKHAYLMDPGNLDARTEGMS